MSTTEKPTGNMNMVDDGIITGIVGMTKGGCEVCGRGTRCIHITATSMPGGIEVSNTILKGHEEGSTITLIGIGCGDYARFHRQVAHIQDKMAAREGKKDKRSKVGGKKSKKKNR